ncbi:hypothetical protein ACAG26_24325 [Mycobacterium sp. pUA109]|uniref:hypothetical protein n=1 Tax=Mycobacterium sp. pUA109 TaxID=3238982 RepID=UPI00351AD4AC
MTGPIGNDVSGDTPAVNVASYQYGTVNVGTTATLIAVIPEGYNGGIVVNAAATGVFVGDASVTKTTGFALPAAPVTIPSGKSGQRSLYGVAASAATDVSYILAAD